MLLERQLYRLGGLPVASNVAEDGASKPTALSHSPRFSRPVASHSSGILQYGGNREIRTLDPRKDVALAMRCLRPLGHASVNTLSLQKIVWENL